MEEGRKRDHMAYISCIKVTTARFARLLKKKGILHHPEISQHNGIPPKIHEV
jgi:hypothetical protein